MNSKLEKFRKEYLAELERKDKERISKNYKKRRMRYRLKNKLN